MKRLDENAMRFLSFPDFDVEKVEFSSADKALKVFVSGAWLDVTGGQELGKGCLYFADWEDFSIHRYDSLNEKWSNVSAMNIDPLKDICEIKFDDSSICLFGFTKQYGQWTEWRIKKSKMSAEFNEK